MKGRTVLLDHIGTVEAAALLVDGRLEDLLLSGSAPAPGTIYRARADRPVKGQGGLFLTTPDGPAFVREVRGVSAGADLLVQVTGYAEPGKAIPVTTRLLFKSRYAIVTPGAPGLNLSRAIRDPDSRTRLEALAAREMTGETAGLILRSAAARTEDSEIADDIRAIRRMANQVMGDAGTGPDLLQPGDGPHDLAWRDWSDPADVVEGAGVFAAHGVLDAIDEVRGPRQELPGGGHLMIEATHALVAVDVNTGPDTSPAAGLKANLGAVRALPRALRLRGLGGQIVVDFAPMPKKDRRGVESALRAALRADSVETVLAGWTPLGHFELQRKRSRLPLVEVLS